MDFHSGLFSDIVTWVANLILLAALALAVRTAPWSRISGHGRIHAYLGGCVALLLLWSLRAGVLPGLSFHFLGVTALTLMFGWQLALIGVTAVAAGSALNGTLGWEVLGLNVLSMGGLPIAITATLLWWAQQRLPLNYFVYVFVNAFLAAGLSSTAVGMLTTLLMLGHQVYPFDTLASGYLAYLPLMFFPEGVINGALIAIFVVYRPQWVATFDDEKYLSGGSGAPPG